MFDVEFNFIFLLKVTADPYPAVLQKAVGNSVRAGTLTEAQPHWTVAGLQYCCTELQLRSHS